MRLTPTEKRAKELSQAVRNIGTAKRPSINLKDITDRYTTQSDDLSMKIAPHIKALREEIMNEMKAMPVNMEISTDMVRQIVAEMKKLPEGDRLEVQDIRNHQAFIFNGKKYGMHEMMHGGSASTGGSISFETPVGAVDDSNVSFSVTNTPLYIIVNGAQYTAGTGLFASYVAPIVTLTSAVGTGGFIISAY